MQAMAQLFGIPGNANNVNPFDGVSMKNQTLATLVFNHDSPAIEALVVALAFSDTGKNRVLEILTTRGITTLTAYWSRLVQDKTLMRRSTEGAPARLVGSSMESGSTSLALFALAAEMPVLGLNLRQGQDIAALQIATMSQALLDTLVNVALAELLGGRATHQAFVQIRGRANALSANLRARQLLFYLNRPYGFPQYMKGIMQERNHKTYSNARMNRLLLPVGVFGRIPYLATTGNRANQGGEAAANRAYAGFGNDGEGEIAALPPGFAVGQVATEIYEGRHKLNQLISNVTDAGYIGFTKGMHSNEKKLYVANFERRVVEEFKLTRAKLAKTGRWDANGLAPQHMALAADPTEALRLTSLDFKSGSEDVDAFVVKDFNSNPSSPARYIVANFYGDVSLTSYTDDAFLEHADSLADRIKAALSPEDRAALSSGLQEIARIRELGGGVREGPRNRFGGVDGAGGEDDDLSGLGNASDFIGLGLPQSGLAVDDPIRILSAKFRVAVERAYRALAPCMPGNIFVTSTGAPALFTPDAVRDNRGYFGGLVAFMSLLDQYVDDRPGPVELDDAQTDGFSDVVAAVVDGFGTSGRAFGFTAQGLAANAATIAGRFASDGLRTALGNGLAVTRIISSIEEAGRAPTDPNLLREIKANLASWRADDSPQGLLAITKAMEAILIGLSTGRVTPQMFSQASYAGGLFSTSFRQTALTKLNPSGNMAYRARLADEIQDPYVRWAALLIIAQPNTLDSAAAWVKCGIPLPFDTIFWQLTTTWRAGTTVVARTGLGRTYYSGIHAMWGSQVVQKSVGLHLTAYLGAAVIDNDLVVHPGAVADEYQRGGGLTVADLQNGKFNADTDMNKFDLIPSIAAYGEMYNMEGQQRITSITGRTPFALVANGTPSKTPTPMLWIGSVFLVIIARLSSLNDTVASQFLLGTRDGGQYSPLAGRRVMKYGDVIFASNDGLGDNITSTAQIKALAAGAGVAQNGNDNVIALYAQ
jgi:hypothetical protein